MSFDKHRTIERLIKGIYVLTLNKNRKNITMADLYGSEELSSETSQNVERKFTYTLTKATVVFYARSKIIHLYIYI